MSTRLSVTVTWFPALEIKTGTANKNRNYHKVLAFFLEKLVDVDGLFVLVDLRPHTEIFMHEL